MHRLAQAFAGLLAVANAAWPVQTYQSEEFTAPAFEIEKTGDPLAPGLLFLGYTKTLPNLMAPMIFEDTGDLVWHGPTGGPVYNFRRQLLHNKQVLTYWSGYLSSSGHGYGNVFILDKDYNQIHEVCLPESENSLVNFHHSKQFPGNRVNPCFVDKHESFITSDNTILITLYNITQTDLTSVGGDQNGFVYDCLFYEMDPITQDIKFKWSALEHVNVADSNFVNKTTGTAANLLNLDGKIQGTKDNPWDFFHINSVQKVTGGYLVNSRMYWSFYMIDNTGNKLWTLEGSNGGDFTLGPGIFFSWEHMPRLDPQASTENVQVFSVFNNDNIPKLAEGTNSSTGYILAADMTTMHVTVIQDLTPDSKLNGVAEGSVQTLANDHNLVGYGAVPVIQEFVGSKLIYSATFAGGNTAHSYRTYRFSWNSQPKTKPKAAASASGTKITAFMSWNGATTYDSWNVYAGKTRKQLTKVASSVAKNGFETSESFTNAGYKFVQVEALSGSNSLATSSIIKISAASKSSSKGKKSKSSSTTPSKESPTSGSGKGGLLGGILGGIGVERV